MWKNPVIAHAACHFDTPPTHTDHEETALQPQMDATDLRLA